MCKKDANPNEKSSNNKSEEKIKFCRVFEAAREQETSNRLSQVIFFQITYHQPSSWLPGATKLQLVGAKNQTMWKHYSNCKAQEEVSQLALSL